MNPQDTTIEARKRTVETLERLIETLNRTIEMNRALAENPSHRATALERVKEGQAELAQAQSELDLLNSQRR